MFDNFKRLFGKNDSDKYYLLEENNKKTTDKSIIVEFHDFIKISILKDLTFEEYVDEMEVYEDDERLELPVKTFLKDGIDFITSKILKQDIYIMTNENSKYIIVISPQYIRIVENRIINDELHEIVLTLNKWGEDFNLAKYIHTLELSTKLSKSYPSSDIAIDAFKLDRIEAFKIIDELIDRIENNEKIKVLVDMYSIYRCTNLLEKDRLTPLISNDEITLSSSFYKDVDLSTSISRNLDIVLNDTREVVGSISVDLDRGFRYSGNVSYDIKKKYRGNHYATKALKLLIELIKKCDYQGNKDLYISVLPNNAPSHAVAKNCGAEIYYEGEVPEGETVRVVDGVKEVVIYQIKLK